jgi:hypothetical protein
VSYAGTTTNDSGYVLVGQVPASVAPGDFNNLDLANATAKCQYYKVVPAREMSKITWRPCDYDDQGAYATVGITAQTLASEQSRPWLIVVGYGLATNAASSLLVEHVTNWEGQFRDPTFSPGGTTEAARNPAAPGWYERLHNIVRFVGPIVSSLVAGDLPSRQNQATKLLTQGGPLIEELD